MGKTRRREELYALAPSEALCPEQYPVGTYPADWPALETVLVVEVDGIKARGTQAALVCGRERDGHLRALGLRLLRVLAAEVVRSMAGVWEVRPSACAEPLPENASWVEARELRKGDVIFVGPEGGAAHARCPT
ncbi:MAG: DUF559 domain-containing protein [Anaerolineae bacterium]|nr:DUF559 domain-containing protein [Anaerolineae bacterium]